MKKISGIILAFCLFQFVFSPSVARGKDVLKSEDEAYTQRSDRTAKFVFSDLPRHLGNDLKDSFWGWGSLGLAVGIGMTVGLHEKDHSIQTSFEPHALFGKTGDEVISQLGAPYTMGAAALLTTLVGVGSHNEKLTTTGEALLESLFWTETLTLGMKYAFDRDRPDGSSRGFPSAHTSGMFSTATVLQVMYGPKIGVPAYALASLVGLARVDSYKHFPSDVLMGAVLGSVIGYGTAHFHKELHHRFTLTPLIQPKQYGLLLHHEF